MKDFKQKIVVITGGGSGMGRSMAIQLAKMGATILTSDVNKAALAETKKIIEADNGKVKTYIVDVGVKEQVYAFAEEVLKE